jgi:methylenetetrahydrofolate reductase (NADPH)
MKVTEHIEKSKGRTLFSVEILPPLKGQNIESTFKSLDPLMEFGIPFIDVTYHREEFEYREFPDGHLEKRIVKKRPGTVGICAAIQNRYKVDAIPHVLCGGFTREETENFLIDISFLGIDNVMALRGDAIKSESCFMPEKGGNKHANELVKQISDMNKGIYLDNELLDTSPTNFCIGVAGYPEKHIEAPSMESDIHFLKEKVRNGANYIITQMFFDNRKYFDFVERCRGEGISVPIIPGIKPIATKRQLNLLPLKFKVDLPDELVKMIVKAKDEEEVRQIGVEWCVGQCRELIKEKVPVIHFYATGRAENIVQVCSSLRK